MTKRDLVLVASRAMALYFVFWALDNLSWVPLYSLSVSHYGSLPTTGGQNYLYIHYLILLIRHLSFAIALFIASVWVYRCGPTISRFLLSPEE